MKGAEEQILTLTGFVCAKYVSRFTYSVGYFLRFLTSFVFLLLISV